MKFSEKVDNYFKKNSSGIYTFAEKYGLKVKEYDQYSEAWRLVFKHPKTGHGFISIFLLPSEIVQVSGFLTSYVYETFSLYTKNKNNSVYNFSENDLLNCLEKVFREMLQWEFNDLKLAGGEEGALKKSWAKFKTKDEWVKASLGFLPNNYPKGYEPKN